MAVRNARAHRIARARSPRTRVDVRRVASDDFKSNRTLDGAASDGLARRERFRIARAVGEPDVDADDRATGRLGDATDATARPTTTTTDDATAALARWARARGVSWNDDALRVRETTARGTTGTTTRRGVFARETIDGATRETKNLIVAPRDAMIACDARDASEDARVKMKPTDELALKLLRHRCAGASDAFAPYVASMPARYNLLQTWSEEERAALQDARAETTAKRASEALRKAFEDVKKEVVDIVGEDEREAFALYEWARATVSSRAVSVPFHEAGALCPMGDMFNYAPHDPPILIDVLGAPAFGVNEGNTTSASSREVATDPIPGDGAWDEESKTFAFRAARQPDGRRSIAADEEIFVCYGEYTNLELLEFYGFTLGPNENPQDYYALDVPVDGAETTTSLKVFVGGFDWDDLADARIAFAKKRSSVRMNEKEMRDVARRGGALGRDAEREAFAAIRDAAAARLLSFPTTAKSDEETLLGWKDGSENLKLAITWRLGIKRILQGAYKLAEARRVEMEDVATSAAFAKISLAHVSTPRERR